MRKCGNVLQKEFFYYLRFYLRCLTNYDSVYIEVGNEA